MKEFIISNQCKLGLMPNHAIAKILKGSMPHPDTGNGIQRCELYLPTNDVTAESDNVLKIGAKLISIVKNRSWKMTSAILLILKEILSHFHQSQMRPTA